MPEWSHALPPGAVRELNNCGPTAVLGKEMPSARAPSSARLRSFWCSSIRKPGSKLRFTMRSPCTSRIRDDAKPPISACRRRKQQGLANRLDRQRHDDLVGDLGGLSVAVGAHQRDVLAHLVEHR